MARKVTDSISVPVNPSFRSNQFFKVHNTQADASDLREGWTFILDLDVTFRIGGPSLVWAMGHCNLRHRKLVVSGGMWGLRLTYRGPVASLSALQPAATLPTPGAWIPGAKTGGNLLNQGEEYIPGHLRGAMLLSAPGYYRIEFWGLSQASAGFDKAAGGPDGIAEVRGTTDPSDPYNQLIVVVCDYPGRTGGPIG